jgi:hypothetical protein
MDNKRKLQVIYWSFLQLGSSALSSEDFWMTLTAVRSSVVNTLPGGMSNVFKMLLPSFFNETTHDFRKGISFKLEGQLQLMFAGFGMMVSDESAIHQTWWCKGASGTRICMLCKNVVDKKADLVQHDASNYLVDTTCCDSGKLDLHTDATIAEIIRKLALNFGVLGKTQFGKMEQELGFSYCPSGLLCDASLSSIARPVRTTTFDWAHVYIVKGLFSFEMGLFMAKLKDHGVDYAMLHEYLQMWVWPIRISARAATGKDCCCPKRAASNLRAGTFKHTASEALSVYPISCMFFREALLPTGVENNACLCFLELCNVLDLLLKVPRGVVSPAALRKAIESHLASFSRVYGVAELMPKHHMSLHFPGMLQTHGTLVSCLTHERKHRMVKRFASNRCNLAAYEKGLLGEIVSGHIEILMDPTTFVEDAVLTGQKEATAKVLAAIRANHPVAEEIYIANEAHVSEFQSCSRRDVVMMSNSLVGEVWFHCMIDGLAFSVVSTWETLGGMKFKCRKNPSFVLTNTIEEVLVYSKTGDVVKVVPPPKLR